HNRDYFRHERQRSVVEEFWIARLPGIAQGYALRGSTGGVECREHGARSRGAQRGRARERSWVGARVGCACAGVFGNRSPLHSRRDADSAQRMPPAEKTQGLIFQGGKVSGFQVRTLNIEAFRTL